MTRIFEGPVVAAALGVQDAHYLGTGTHGETWRVQRTGRDCAVKIIHLDGYSVQRLDREIEGYRRVSDSNVVAMYDAYSVVIEGINRAALEFEYVDGGDLSAFIGRGEPTAEELRNLAIGLLRGVRAMHAADLLHRDLKPANIALRDGRLSEPVILDLGLAKLLDIETITRYPQLIGTPLYMAPEQIRGSRALRASDLWAVGAVLYEVAAGSHPFFNEGESLTINEALTRMTTPVNVPDRLPNEVADLISRCLLDPPYRRGTVTKALDRLTRKES